MEVVVQWSGPSTLLVGNLGGSVRNYGVNPETFVTLSSNGQIKVIMEI